MSSTKDLILLGKKCGEIDLWTHIIMGKTHGNSEWHRKADHILYRLNDLLQPFFHAQLENTSILELKVNVDILKRELDSVFHAMHQKGVYILG